MSPSPHPRSASRARAQSGQAAVESALTLPLVVFLFLGTLQLFLVLQARILAQYALSRAARAGSLNHGSCKAMQQAAIATLLPSFDSFLSPSARGATPAEKYVRSLQDHLNNRFVPERDSGHDQEIVWIYREHPTPAEVGARDWEEEFDLPVSSLAPSTGASPHPLTLELRMVYWYPLRIPFANSVWSLIMRTHFGLQDYRGTNPLMPVQRDAHWAPGGQALTYREVGDELIERLRRNQYSLPIQTTYVTRMMTPPRREHFPRRDCVAAPSFPLKAPMRDRRGQTLVLFALLMLAMMLMALMTLSLGNRARQRMELQTVADAASYSNAIATARTYNTAALLNRAAVSHWVAMAGVQSLHAWGTLTSAYLGDLGSLSYEFQAPLAGAYCAGLGRAYNPGTPSKNYLDGDSFDSCPEAWDGAEGRQCAAKTWVTRDAAYEFWHARYSLYRPRDGGSGEPVNADCMNGNCTVPRTRLDPGYGQLDEDVADQARSIREAIHNLTMMQRDTYDALEEVLDQQTLTTTLLRQSQGLSSTGALAPPGFAVPGTGRGSGSSRTRHPAWREVSDAVTLSPERRHDAALASTVLGSVGLRFPLALENADGDAPHPPKKLTRFVREIQRYVDGNHPDTFRFVVSPSVKGCASFTQSRMPAFDDLRKCDRSDLGMGAVSAVAVGHITVSYRDGCTGQWRTRERDVVAGVRSSSYLRSRDENPDPAAHTGSVDFGPGWFVQGCHGDHGYHGNYYGPYHNLGPSYDDHRIQPGGLSFVFPEGEDEGSQGAGSQPKLPLLLTRAEARPDPWDLMVRFRFRADGGETRLDLGKDDTGVSSDVRGKPLGALAHGMAYYHRRGHWDEPANLLNPFWRATLVRSNVDATRREANDRTDDLLDDAGLEEAAKVYRRLQGNDTFEAWQ